MTVYTGPTNNVRFLNGADLFYGNKVVLLEYGRPASSGRFLVWTEWF